MGVERSFMSEHEASNVQTLTLPLAEVSPFHLYDPLKLEFQRKKITVMKNESSQTLGTEYLAVIDKELGPRDLHLMLENISSRSHLGLYKKEHHTYSQRLPLMHDLYETTVFSQPITPGHDIINTKKHKNDLLYVLTADKLSPDDVIGQKLGVFLPLDRIQEELLNGSPISPKILRDILFTRPDPDIHLQILALCNISPEYTTDINGNATLDTQSHKNKIVRRMLSPRTQNSTPRINELLSSINSDELDTLTKSYAISMYGGYTKPEDNTIVFGIGEQQEILEDEQKIQFTYRNLVIEGEFHPLSDDPTTYTLIPYKAQLRRYIAPALRWNTTGRHSERSWNLDIPVDFSTTPTQDSIHYNPLIGLTTLVYLDQKIMNNWNQRILNPSLFTPEYIPTLTAVNQTDLLTHPLLPEIENIF